MNNSLQNAPYLHADQRRDDDGRAASEAVVKRTEWEAMHPDQRRRYADPTRKCIEKDCREPAGTPWGPYWCADHDDERINRISRNLRGIVDDLHRHRIEERMVDIEVGP